VFLGTHFFKEGHHQSDFIVDIISSIVDDLGFTCHDLVEFSGDNCNQEVEHNNEFDHDGDEPQDPPKVNHEL